MRDKVNIGNVQVDNVTLKEALEEIEHLVTLRKPCYINSVNVDVVIRYNKDKEYAHFYDAGKLCIADGMLILWAARFLGLSIIEKVSGSDLVTGICELAHNNGFKIFFLGGRPGAALSAKLKMQETFNTADQITWYCPPYDFEKYSHELEKIARIVKRAKPDILLVGLGAPKREKWIKEYYRKLDVPVSLGVGASFEWIGGMLKRAPRWMQNMGLEWLWRLLLEPRRLWRRYLIDDLPFFALLLEQKLRQSKSYSTEIERESG